MVKGGYGAGEEINIQTPLRSTTTVAGVPTIFGESEVKVKLNLFGSGCWPSRTRGAAEETVARTAAIMENFIVRVDRGSDE